LYKPLRPLWVSATNPLWEEEINYEELPFIPIILVSVSPNTNKVTVELPNGCQYIQGAGDDEESWSNVSYWKYRDNINVGPDTFSILVKFRLYNGKWTSRHPKED
jgi:hypothetical protein